MNVNQIKTRLQLSFNKELPGEHAHKKMTPLNRSLQPLKTTVPKQSAVLVLITTTTPTSVVLIQRPKYNGVHSNQIALPGGKMEISDLSLLETAQRETQEEIGVKQQQYAVLGQLTTLYIPPSNFYVTPFVAIAKNSLTYTPEENEVAEIIEFPIVNLLSHQTKKEQLITMSTGYQLNTMSYLYEGRTIWGATAMILSELEHMLKM